MEYMRFFRDTIMARQSCRKFLNKEIGIEEMVEVNRVYDNLERLVPEIKTDIKFTGAEAGKKFGDSVGYNGFSIEAPQYIILMSEVKDFYLENAGYLAQAMTLKLTDLGIAACWLTVNDSDRVKEAADLDSKLEVACVIGIGYRDKDTKEKRLDIVSPSNVTMTKTELQAAPKISLDSLLFDKMYGKAFNKEELYTELEDSLLAVSHAQSFFNRQPYRVIVGDSEIYLVGVPDEMTGENDRHLNYGIAMFNFVAVLGSLRAEAPKWSFDTPTVNLGLPDGVFYVAKCRI